MDMKPEGSRNPALPLDGGSITRPSSDSATCAACQKPIRESYLLKALEQFWHKDCLKCACCDCRLGEVGSTLFTKANLILCKRDYLRKMSEQNSKGPVRPKGPNLIRLGKENESQASGSKLGKEPEKKQVDWRDLYLPETRSHEAIRREEERIDNPPPINNKSRTEKEVAVDSILKVMAADSNKQLQ